MCVSQQIKSHGPPMDNELVRPFLVANGYWDDDELVEKRWPGTLQLLCLLNSGVQWCSESTLLVVGLTESMSKIS